MNAAIVYWSKTGNTQKVALAIREALEAARVETLLTRPEEAADLDWYGVDLLCIGFPSYQWSPPKPMDDYLKATFRRYSRQGRVQVGAPPVPGKHVLIFCTFTGPHTGLDEVIPAAKYAGQFFAHLGFTVLDEWYVPGEYHGREELSTRGRMGDVRGRPDKEDLKQVKQDVVRLLERIQSQPAL